ncbi:MAG: DUF805 domain-containing protein [Bifidobacteriaceae bacterium]|jgi:uncharacterized membrane protein YhaH (DUF805 family)|nr:DUF805 domain-containing protein [Bifidobacteriaceae bacterium]
MTYAYPTPAVAPSLDQPYYGASLGKAVARFFRKYATFSGRASRSEYWWTYLFVNVVFMVLYAPCLVAIVSAADSFTAWVEDIQNASQRGSAIPELPDELAEIFTGLTGVSFTIGVVWSFAILVPMLALTWRRLHDANLPGPLFFLGVIPLVLMILCLLGPNPEGKRFDLDGGQSGPLAAPPDGYPLAGYGEYPPPGQPGGYTPPGYGWPQQGGYPPPENHPVTPPPPYPGGVGGYAPPAEPPEPTVGPDGLPRHPG